MVMMLPHQQLVLVFWNWEFNLYKEQIAKMKHNLEGSNGNVAPKQQCVKEVERSITPKDLEMVNFIAYMHEMTWSMEKRKASWVEKVGLTQFWKFD
jgi:hypothetical protein